VAKALGAGAGQGVLVAPVEAGSPAAEAGLRGGSSQVTLQGQMYVTGGDIITELDGKTLDGMEDLAAAINGRDPGDTVRLTILRDSATTVVTLTLADRSSAPTASCATTP
jgi:S1-C subfamily serine protease